MSARKIKLTLQGGRQFSLVPFDNGFFGALMLDEEVVIMLLYTDEEEGEFIVVTPERAIAIANDLGLAALDAKTDWNIEGGH